MNITTLPNFDEVAIVPQSLDRLDQHRKAAREALLALKFNRAYALDSVSETSLVAAFRVLWTAIQEELMEKITNPDFLKRVVPFETSLVQKWKLDAVAPPEPLPQPWVDPVTNQPLPNPWLSGIDAHFKPQPNDRDSQTVLIALDPKLAAHFQAMAKSPYRHLAELREKAAKRAAIASVEYNAQIHKGSPYVADDDQLIANFIQSHTQPVIEVFQRERLPVRCFWSPLYSGDGPNRTRQSEAIKTDPLIGHLLLAATKVEGELVRLQREEAAAEKNAAAAREKSLTTAN